MIPEFNTPNPAIAINNNKNWIDLINLVGVEEVVNMRFKAPRFFDLAYPQPNRILS
jgi:hypothetical protein